MPNAMLKGMVMNGLTEQDGNMDIAIAKACEFMQERLESLGQTELASRLTLNCTPGFVQPHLVNDLPVTIIDVWDDCALSQQVSYSPTRDDLTSSELNCTFATAKYYSSKLQN